MNGASEMIEVVTGTFNMNKVSEMKEALGDIEALLATRSDLVLLSKRADSDRNWDE